MILLFHRMTRGLILLHLGWALSTSVVMAAEVRIIEQADGFALLLDGKAFHARGAGTTLSDVDALGALADAGANSFRTWSTEALDAQLAAAAKHDLYVLAGLNTGTPLKGFDYSDAEAVQKQSDALLREVERYKTHPNLLGWIIANEPNLAVDTRGELVPVDPKVYDILGELAAAIKARDPAHPVVMSFAFTPTIANDIAVAVERMPALDIIGIQAYGALVVVPELIDTLALGKPWMVTEFGALGHWETPSTTWGREIEEPSGVKAAGLALRLQQGLTDPDDARILGSFAFLWGQKQERTPTWYGLLTERGHRVASVDELTRFWTGSYPRNRAPLATAISIDGREPLESVVLERDATARVRVTVNDPDGDALEARFELLEEVIERSHGGLPEQRPPAIPLNMLVSQITAEAITGEFRVPRQPGEYRLFVYAVDASGGVATANQPFRVQ